MSEEESHVRFLQFLQTAFKSYSKLQHFQYGSKKLRHSSLLLEIVEDSVLGRWEGGDKEQSSVVSATDNERSVCPAMILLVWIRQPGLIPGSWPLSCCSAFPVSARFLNFLANQVCPERLLLASWSGLRTDWLLMNWLKSEDVGPVSQPSFKKSKLRSV